MSIRLRGTTQKTLVFTQKKNTEYFDKEKVCPIPVLKLYETNKICRSR